MGQTEQLARLDAELSGRETLEAIRTLGDIACATTEQLQRNNRRSHVMPVGVGEVIDRQYSDGHREIDVAPGSRLESTCRLDLSADDQPITLHYNRVVRRNRPVYNPARRGIWPFSWGYDDYSSREIDLRDPSAEIPKQVQDMVAKVGRSVLATANA